MARTYTNEYKFTLGTIGNLLKTKPASEWARTKATELTKFTPPRFQRDGFDIRITQQPTRVGEKLKIIVVATYNGQAIPNFDGIMYFYNPPIMVHDGTYFKTKNKFGDDVELMNYVEDAEEALRQAIVDTLKTLV